MTARNQITERDVAAKLAERIRSAGSQPSIDDEADRDPSDRSPAYANALMTPPDNGMLALSPTDWNLVCDALDHYSTCPNV